MFLRFLMVGGLGFLIDAGLTYVMIRLRVESWLARIPAMLLAMAFTWLANRHFTFEVKRARSINEGLRYAAVGMAMAMFNYAAYLIFVHYGMWPVTAVTVATACQTIISFYAYNHLVFRK